MQLSPLASASLYQWVFVLCRLVKVVYDRLNGIGIYDDDSYSSYYYSYDYNRLLNIFILFYIIIILK